jgi:hypothetical protein
MDARQQTRTRHAHSVEIRQVYERVLAGTSVRSRAVELGAAGRVHLLESGGGKPVVLLHGTGNPAGFLARCWRSSTGSTRSPPTDLGWA